MKKQTHVRDRVKTGNGSRSRKTPADYCALAHECGFAWIGPEVPMVTIKTEWQCSQGHRWQAHYNSIQQGHGCPYCAGVARKTRSDYEALANLRGFKWLGPEVPNTTIRTWWQCPESHRWDAIYSTIQQGHGCPYCANRIPKTPADYEALANLRGFKWLGPEVPNTTIRTWWQCPENHRWDAIYSTIRQGRGCPYCAGIARKTPPDYEALASLRGFKWLGPEVPNQKTKTWWECSSGHRWQARYGDIRRGSRCPECHGMTNGVRSSRQQRKLAEMLRGDLNVHQDPYTIDIGVERSGCKIAVEYDAWYWHAHMETYETQRTKWLNDKGWHVLQIRSGSRLPTPEQLEGAMRALQDGAWHIEIVLDDWGKGMHRLSDESECRTEEPKELRKQQADYHALAAKRGFKWLGPEAPNIQTKTKWECAQGHQWEARYGSIYTGCGCPYCANRVPKTTDDYCALATERGFKWLGPEVLDTRTKTWWECSRGHRWQSNYSDIYSGRGCPYCANRIPKTPADYQALAVERGFKWLGPEVLDTQTKTWWECEHGHQWQAIYANVKRGSGCRKCAGLAPKTADDFLTLASERGFKWLGTRPVSVHVRTEWECPKGHRWQAPYNSIQQGHGCPQCAGRGRRSRM